MKTFLIAGAVLGGVLAASADTNLVNSKTWRVDGGVDAGPNPHDINVVVDGVPAGAFSELKMFYNLGRTNLQQVFAVRGEGTILPLVPPPVVTGGVFRLTSYRDCEQGLIGPMMITDLEFKTPRGSSNVLMLVKGKLSNSNSLLATTLKMKFTPPETNTVLLDVQYKLTATRDICVDQALHDTQDVFRIAEMAANFVSPATNQVTRLRYLRNKDKVCNGADCVKIKEVFCADLDGVPGYFLTKPRSLGDGAVNLLHTNSVPRNTPTLGILFTSPSHGRIKPQAFFVPTADPAELNVAVWGNWLDVRKDYAAGKTVARVHVIVGARDPSNPGCDTIRQ